MSDEKITLSFYLPKQQADQLKEVAFRASTSVSDVLRQLLDDPHNQAKLRAATRQQHGIFK